MSTPTGDRASRSLDSLDAEVLVGSLIGFLRALVDVDDGDAVTVAAADGPLRAWTPDLVSIFLVDEAGTGLELVGSTGLTAEQVKLFSWIPLDLDLPITRLFASGGEASVRVRDAGDRFPLLASWAESHPHRDTAETVGLPLRSQGRTIGMVVVSFPLPLERSWRCRTTLDGVTAALTVWALTQRAARATRPRAPGPRGGLQPSARQAAVLAGVRQGQTNAQLAEALGCSVSTVKGDLAALFRMVGATSRADLIRRADSAGL